MHLQPTDLAIQLVFARFDLGGLGVGLAREHFGQPRDQFFFPLAHLHGVDRVPGGNRMHWLDASQGFQRDFGFQFGIMLTAFFGHVDRFILDLDLTIPPVQFSGSTSGRRTGNRFVHVEPSPKARLHLGESVREELNHWTKYRSCAEAVRRVNRITRGWSNAYDYGHSTRGFGRQRVWRQNRGRRWRWRKYDCKDGLFSFFTAERLLGHYELWPLPRTCAWRR